MSPGQIVPLQCHDMGHNGHGINLYDVLMRNLHGGHYDSQSWSIDTINSISNFAGKLKSCGIVNCVEEGSLIYQFCDENTHTLFFV